MQRTRWAPLAAGIAELIVIGVLGAIVTDSLSGLIWFPLAIVGLSAVHEFSQAFIGRVLDFDIRSVRIGSGPVILRLKIADAPVNVRAFPMLGAMNVETTRAESLRRRAAAFALAGVAGVLLVALFLALFVDNPARLALGLAVLLSAANLIPGTLDLSTRSVDNDGLVLLRTLTERDALLEERWLLPGYLRLYRRGLRRRDFADAVAISVRAATFFPDDVRWSLLRARALAGIDPHAARRELIPLVGRVWTDDEHANEFALVCNAVAYQLLRAGTRDAMPLAQEAVRLRPDDPSVASTLAFALVEDGLADDALRVLEPLLHLPLEPNDQAGVLCVQAMGLARIGKRQEAERAMADAYALDGTCALLARADAIVASPLTEGTLAGALVLTEEQELDDLLQRFAEIHESCDVEQLVAIGNQLGARFPDEPIARLEQLHARVHAEPLRHLDAMQEQVRWEPYAGWPRVALGCAAGQVACALLGSGRDPAEGMRWAHHASGLTERQGAIDAWALAANGQREEAHALLDATVPQPPRDTGWAHEMLVRAAAYAQLGEIDVADAMLNEAMRAHPECQWLLRYQHFIATRRKAG